jgi:hypothetical protein
MKGKDPVKPPRGRKTSGTSGGASFERQVGCADEAFFFLLFVAILTSTAFRDR